MTDALRPDPASRPNILLIHWHDLGTHLGTYGLRSRPSPSPVLDALAAEGTRFERAYSTAPLCSPARSSIFTGRYPHANGMNGLASRGCSYYPDEVTLPTYLNAAGYRTALVGLQHESTDATTLGYGEIVNSGGSRRCGDVAKAAGQWLAEMSHTDQPWLLVAGFQETHRPYGPERYPLDDPDEVDVPGWLPDNDWTRDDLAAFQGAIRVADGAVGRILDALEQSGLKDDTWVIFTTDHGPAVPGGKSTLYEPGTHVALIQQYPAAWGVPSGPTDRFFSHVDLLPTILERLGLDVPDRIQGRSDAAWLSDPKAPGRDAVFSEKTFHNHYDPMRSIRTDRYRLIRSWEHRPMLVLAPGIEGSPTRLGYGDDHLRHRPLVQLFDVCEDPIERVDLAEDRPDVRDELVDRLTQWQRDTGDPVLDGPIPPPVWPRFASFGALDAASRNAEATAEARR